MRERADTLPLRAPSAARFLIVAWLVPVLLVALVVWLQTEYRRSEHIQQLADASFDRRIDQLVLLSRLKDAETAQRGYLLTGDASFLRLYEPARRSIREQLAAAGERHSLDVSPNYLPALERLVARRFAALDRGLALYRAGDRVAAARFVRTGGGQQLMDALRVMVGRMIASEQRMSDARYEAFLDYRAWLQRVVYTVVSILIVTVFASLMVSWRLRVQRHASLLDALDSAERHAAILDATIDAILILDPHGAVETVNAAATRMLGYAPVELEGRHVDAILDLAAGQAGFHALIGPAEGHLHRSVLSDLSVRHRDGHMVAVDVAIGVLNLPRGRHLVVSLRDIAERKRIDRVKDELISTVSHELRTPLTSIVGSLGLLRAGAAGPVPAGAARLVDIAENNSRRLIRLINDMLDIDRIESGKLSVERDPIDLRAVIDEACVGSEGLAGAQDVTLRCATPPHAVIVSGDADRLVQVVTNLLSNAIRVAPRGSAVDMAIALDAGRAVVTVEDRGPGVPVAFRDRLFGRFERAESGDGGTGTGLGLAISREIVLRHDGALWHEDRPGGGARFAFALPLPPVATDRDDGAPAVLVCEADEAQARDLIAIAAASDCACDRVRSAAEARTAVAWRGYAVLLVSATLPDGDGAAFVRALRGGSPPVDLPAILIGAASAATAEDADALDRVERVAACEPALVAHALRRALAVGGGR